jgi:hypothetical protein
MANWMTASLQSLRWKMLLLGIAAGIWGAFLGEATDYLRRLAGLGAGWEWLPAGGFGAALALLLASIDELLQHRPRRTLRAAGFGCALGGVFGAGSFALAAETTDGSVVLEALASAVLLALIGASAGLASTLGRGGLQAQLRRTGLGLLAGLGAGLPLAYGVLRFPEQHWLPMPALGLWGGLVALLLYWWEKRFARRWFRLLTGPGEDSIFPLRGALIRLGKNERNDIPLLHYQEIYPYHCQVCWVDDHYEIVDNEQGGTVQVNYRQIQEQALKPGDIVRIGTALLQYGEAS